MRYNLFFCFICCNSTLSICFILFYAPRFAELFLRHKTFNKMIFVLQSSNLWISEKNLVLKLCNYVNIFINTYSRRFQVIGSKLLLLSEIVKPKYIKNIYCLFEVNWNLRATNALSWSVEFYLHKFIFDKYKWIVSVLIY